MFQWVECGWMEFSPQWVDGPICPYEVDIPRQGFGWDVIKESPIATDPNRRKKLFSQQLCLQAVIKCFILIQGSPYSATQHSINE